MKWGSHSSSCILLSSGIWHAVFWSVVSILLCSAFNPLPWMWGHYEVDVICEKGTKLSVYTKKNNVCIYRSWKTVNLYWVRPFAMIRLFQMWNEFRDFKRDKTLVVFFSCIHHFYLYIYMAVPVSRFCCTFSHFAM
jgi:hypothetical protein